MPNGSGDRSVPDSGPAFGVLQFAPGRRRDQSHFVDDRAEVLEYLVDTVPHLYLFGPQDDPPPSQILPVVTWPVAEQAITQSLVGTSRRRSQPREGSADAGTGT